MATLRTIETWDEVLRMARNKTYLWYHAPLDVYPCPVSIRKVYKNGKVRVWGGATMQFTADAGHLSRFRCSAFGVTPVQEGA